MEIEVKIEDFSPEVLEAKNDAVVRFLEEAGLHLQGEAANELENKPCRVDTGRRKGSSPTHDRTIRTFTSAQMWSMGSSPMRGQWPLLRTDSSRMRSRGTRGRSRRNSRTLCPVKCP